jgi:hypothetical protein
VHYVGYPRLRIRYSVWPQTFPQPCQYVMLHSKCLCPYGTSYPKPHTNLLRATSAATAIGKLRSLIRNWLAVSDVMRCDSSMTQSGSFELVATPWPPSKSYMAVGSNLKEGTPKSAKIRARTSHSGGNDRFCARLKTDISAFNSGLRGRTRSCLTFLERGRRDESKMVRHDLR